MILYGDLNSGNCLKVKYAADHLGLPLGFQHVDVMTGDTRTPAFYARNPWGQVPVVQLDDGQYLTQSNAILRYLAVGSALLPAGALEQARIDEWLFWEQYSHEPYVGVCRFVMFFEGKPASARDPQRVQRGEKALDFMESQLATQDWLALGRLTIADIALVAYTQFAHQGGFDLSIRPNLTAWVRRVQDALGLPHTLPN